MDSADIANDRAQIAIDSAVSMARRAVQAMESATPGECADCGEGSPRLIGGFCPECRDYRYARNRAAHGRFARAGCEQWLKVGTDTTT